jgi:hypothetical protein
MSARPALEANTRKQIFLLLFYKAVIVIAHTENRIQHILSNGQTRPIRFVKSEMNLAVAGKKSNKDKEGRLVVVC